MILDSDLADIYGVTTSALNQAVMRNAVRFPEDFAFILDPGELASLKSQTVISSSGHGGRRKPPRVFTEHGGLDSALRDVYQKPMPLLAPPPEPPRRRIGFHSDEQ